MRVTASTVLQRHSPSRTAFTSVVHALKKYLKCSVSASRQNTDVGIIVKQHIGDIKGTIVEGNEQWGKPSTHVEVVVQCGVVGLQLFGGHGL